MAYAHRMWWRSLHAAVQNVATLPTLDEARAKIVGILRTPAQKLATILLAPATKIAILNYTTWSLAARLVLCRMAALTELNNRLY